MDGGLGELFVLDSFDNHETLTVPPNVVGRATGTGVWDKTLVTEQKSEGEDTEKRSPRETSAEINAVSET